MKTILTIGLPGSGKSTWACKYIQQSTTKTIKISRDDIRSMISGSYQNYKFNRFNESLVIDLTKSAIKIIVDEGYDIILDETNLKRKGRTNWVEYIKSINPNMEFYYKEFNIDTEECKKRRFLHNKGCDANWSDIINIMNKKRQSIIPIENILEYRR